MQQMILLFLKNALYTSQDTKKQLQNLKFSNKR